MRFEGKFWRAGFGLLVLGLGLGVSGCAGGYAKRSSAVAAATAPVVDEAKAAYGAANSIHERDADFKAVAAFDDAAQVYNPRSYQPLFSEKAIDVRLAVLEALQCYVKTLVEITDGTHAKDLDAAAKTLGSSLGSLGDAVGSRVEGTGSTTGATAPAPIVSTVEQSALTTGIDALGKFLVSRKIKKDLPREIKAMDPALQALCALMSSEAETLRSQEKLDFDDLVDGETLYLRSNPKLDGEARRELIMKLPALVREQRTADAQLVELKGSLAKLAAAHKKLAAEAEDNKPESLRAGLRELAEAGTSLGKFYSSLAVATD